MEKVLDYLVIQRKPLASSYTSQRQETSGSIGMYDKGT